MNYALEEEMPRRKKRWRRIMKRWQQGPRLPTYLPERTSGNAAPSFFSHNPGIRCVIRAQIFGKPTFFWLISSFLVNQLVNARLRAPELQGSAAVSDATNNKTKQNKTLSGRK